MRTNTGGVSVGRTLKRLTKRILCLVSEALILFGLTSCADDGTAAATTDTETPDTAALVTGRLELSTWWIDPGEADALSSLLDLFHNRYPNVEEVKITTYIDYTGWLDAQIDILENDETPPDITSDGPMSSLRFRAFQGDPEDNRLEPLDNLYEEAGWNDAFPEEVRAALRSEDGVTYVTPLGVARLNSLFYNPVLVSDPPSSVSAFLSLAQSLQAKGILPLVIPSVEWELGHVLHGVVASVGGADWYARYAEGALDLSDPEQAAPLVEAVEGFAQMLTYAAVPEDGDWKTAAEMICKGDAAMYIYPDWAKGYMTSLGYLAGVDFGSVAPLGSDDSIYFVMETLVMFNEGANRDNAFRFLELAGSAEGQTAFGLIKGNVPLHPDIDITAWDAVAANTKAHFDNATFRLHGEDAPNLSTAAAALYSGETTQNVLRGLGVAVD